MKKCLLVFLLVSLFLSCSKSELESNKLQQILVSTEQISDKLKYSDLLDDVKPIKLETKDSTNVLIEVNKVFIDKDKIFILDKFRFQGVMVFDTSGRFLYSKKIGGGAEGEFTHLSGMSVDTKKNELIIFSTPKLLYYTYEGKFIRQKVLDFLGNDFETNGDIYTFIGQEFGWILTDTSGKIISKKFEVSKLNPLKFLQPFQVIKDGILYRHSFNDTIYLATSSGLEKYAFINFQERRLTNSETENMVKNRQTKIPPGKMGRIKYFFNTENIIYFAFEYNDMLYVAFYDKRNKTTKIIRGNAKEQNDVTLEETLPNVVGAHQNQLIAVANAQETFLDLKNLVVNKFSYKVISSFQNKGKPNAIHNPNIILMKLK